jgi:ABC-type multidrug transport system permease subunit
MRETSANAYSVSAYVLGKFFAEFSFQIVFPMVFAVIFYFMAGFQSQADIFFTFAMFVILAAMSAVSLGYLIGSVAPTVGAALALGPLLLMPLVIFGGLLINVDDIDPWFVWISYLSFVRYGFEGVSK